MNVLRHIFVGCTRSEEINGVLLMNFNNDPTAATKCDRSRPLQRRLSERDRFQYYCKCALDEEEDDELN